jgi:ABC-type Zn2+ transport system substrate-binding protein/surface adhesin
LKGFIFFDKTNEEYEKEVFVTHLKTVNHVLIKNDIYKIEMIVVKEEKKLVEEEWWIHDYYHEDDHDHDLSHDHTHNHNFGGVRFDCLYHSIL